MSAHQWQVFRGDSGLWCWRLRSASGRVLASADDCPSWQEAARSAQEARRAMVLAVIGADS